MMLFFSTDLLKDILLLKEYYSFYCKSKYFKTSFPLWKSFAQAKIRPKCKTKNLTGRSFPRNMVNQTYLTKLLI